MKIKISLLLLSICFSLNISAKTEYYELVDSAEVNIKEKRWDRAESFLKELLRSYPDDNNNSLIISNLAGHLAFASPSLKASSLMLIPDSLSRSQASITIEAFLG